MHRNTDGTRLVSDRAGDSLTDPPGRIGRELVTTAIFKLIYRFHQADITFLNQVEELQTAVGIFLGNRNNQTQVRFHHLFLGATGLSFTYRHATVNVFHLLNGQAGLFFNLCQFLQGTHHVILHFQQLLRPRLVHCQCGFEPAFIGFVAGKQRDEVFLRHFAQLNTELHNQTFLGTDTFHHGAHAAYQVIELLRYQAELLEDVGKVLDFGNGSSMTATFTFNHVAGGFILLTQVRKLLACQFRVDRVIVVGAVIILFIFFIVVVTIGFRKFGAHVRCRRGQIFFCVRIDETRDQIGEA